MISKEVTIKNSVGLHARPATFFIQKANTYKSTIWVERDDRKINAKSLLGVLSLGIVKDMTITIIADGNDEQDAVNGLCALIESPSTRNICKRNGACSSALPDTGSLFRTVRRGVLFYGNRASE